jgi:hypothetical protein
LRCGGRYAAEAGLFRDRAEEYISRFLWRPAAEPLGEFPKRPPRTKPPAFSVLARFASAKLQRESFKAGGEAIEFRWFRHTKAGYVRDRGISHRNFPPDMAPRHRNTRTNRAARRPAGGLSKEKCRLDLMLSERRRDPAPCSSHTAMACFPGPTEEERRYR